MLGHVACYGFFMKLDTKKQWVLWYGATLWTAFQVAFPPDLKEWLYRKDSVTRASLAISLHDDKVTLGLG
jgi:hypothetical protein